MKKNKLFLTGMIILALAFFGCTPLSEVSGEQDHDQPEGEVQTEPYSRGGADASQGEQDGQNDELARNIVCEIHPLLNNEVLFKITNNSDEDIQQLTMHTEFYDEQENSITDFEYYFKGVAAGQVLYAFSTHLKQYEIEPDNCRITYKMNRSDAGYVNASLDIEIEGEIREGSDYTFGVTLVSTSSETIDYANAFMLFYNEGEITGASERFAQKIAPGGSAELSFMPTQDAEGRMISYDNYQVVVSEAYYKK